MSNSLEIYLDQLHATYEAQGRAAIAKVPTPGEPVRRRGEVLYRQDKAVWTDFTGLMLVGGRAIVLEAKESGLKKLPPGAQVNPVSYPLSRLEPIQRTRLFQAANAGAISALYIRRSLTYLRMQDYLVPALVCAVLRFAGQVPGKKSIKWAYMEPWRIPQGRTWLDAVVAGSCTEFRWPAYQRGGWAALAGPVSSAAYREQGF